MRRALFSVMGISFCALALGQVLPEEEKALSDALFLNNLTLNDLNFFRRPVAEQYPNEFIHSCLDKPLQGIASTVKVHEGAYQEMPSELIRTARMDLLGDSIEYREPITDFSKETIPESVPAQARPIVQYLGDALSEANIYVHKALSGLTPDEKRELIDSLPDWLAGEDLKLDFTRHKNVDQAKILALLAKVNLPLIRRAAEALAVETEREIPRLMLLSRTLDWNGEVTFTYRGIKLYICGKGEHQHSSKTDLLVLNLGGRLTYRGREGAGALAAALLIDTNGKATFEQKDLGAGCGFLGIGLAYVLGPDNSFRAGSMAMGCGVAGVGVLSVAGGNNTYAAKNLSEGFGGFGIGAVLTTVGHNRFDGVSWSQAAARTGGVGWIVNREGGNFYQLRGVPLTGASYGQAYSAGVNEEPSGLGGGIALISDGSGSNTFLGTSDCQGSAADFGLSSIYQPSGEHDFIASRRAQAYAQKQSVAQILTLDGNGSFVLREGDGQSFAASDAVAVLLNRKGDNTFVNDSAAPTTAVNQGLALFIHDQGKNHLTGAPAVGIDTGEGNALGVFVDMDSTLGDQNVATVRPGMGLALQEQSGKHAVMGRAVSRMFPRAGSEPLPGGERLVALYAQATDPNTSQSDRELAQDQFVSFGQPGLDWLLSNELATPSAEGRVLIGLVAKLIGPTGRNAVALKISDANDLSALNALRICMVENFSEASPLVLSALARPALQKKAIEAAGQFRVKDAASTVMVLAGSKDVDLQAAAMKSLAVLGDPGALSTGQSLLASSDLMVKEAAIDLVASLPGGMDAAKILVRDPDEVVARTGIQILGKIATPEALDVVGQALSDMKSGVRIQAILALNGRVPEKYKSNYDSLKQDPSALVRAVIAGLSRQ